MTSMKEELDVYGPPVDTGRICYFDLEATGLDPHEDRIVEIAMMTGLPGDLEAEMYQTLVNPERPIPPGTTEVHGITDEDVLGAPTFREIAEDVERMVTGAVLVGYNIRRFDTILLDTELRRAGRVGLPRDDRNELAVTEVDLYQVWRHSEPRNLSTAVERFGGITHEDEHRAAGDVAVLPHVLSGMASHFGLLDPDADDLADDTVEKLTAISRPEWEVDRSGKFRREDDGTVTFNFGKNRGDPVKDHKGYLRWMKSAGDFPPDTLGWVDYFLSFLN